MATDKKQINYCGIHTVSVDYKGVQIIQNSLNGGWMLFFSKDGKYPNESPFVGTLTQMKNIINDAIKIGKDGEKQFIKPGTYV
jgi:hypothetical protein